jgi:hypothetical protein
MPENPALARYAGPVPPTGRFFAILQNSRGVLRAPEVSEFVKKSMVITDPWQRKMRALQNSPNILPSVDFSWT